MHSATSHPRRSDAQASAAMPRTIASAFPNGSAGTGARQQPYCVNCEGLQQTLRHTTARWRVRVRRMIATGGIVMLGLAASSVAATDQPSVHERAPAFGSEVRPEATIRIEPEVLDEIDASPDGTCYVIVLLRSVGRLDPQRQQQYQDAVAGIQDRVLATIGPDQFSVVMLYRNIPAMTGYVDRAGLAVLARSPDVISIGPDVRMQATLAESVPFIHADQVHDLGFTGQGITVAVLDTGVDTDHDDLITSIAPGGWHSFNDENEVGPGADDDHGHGTHVAGIITSDGNVASIGVAPGADILPIKVLNAQKDGWTSDWINGIDYVLSVHSNYERLAVMNMSLGTDDLYSNCPCDDDTTANQTMQTSLQNAIAVGIITFASTGNDGACGSMRSPACLSGAVAVAAVYDGDYGGGHSDTVTPFSNRSPCNELAAPGFEILAPWLHGGTRPESGTSMASPHAAAVAALMLERDTERILTPTVIRDLLHTTGASVVDDQCSILPAPVRVDALAAVAAVDNAPSTRVISPNGGETFCTGYEMHITWQTTGDCGDVRLDLDKDGTPYALIANDVYNDGSYSWNVSDSLPIASTYQVRITCLSSGAADSSDGYFSIDVCAPLDVIYVRNVYDLQAICSDAQHPIDGHYVLANDIDASGIANFQPIGDNSSNYFRGTFDGQGYTISDLTIEHETRVDVGLFSVLMSGSTIRDVTLNAVTILGKESVGALVGTVQSSTIENCHLIGESRVETTDSDPGDELGGLVGGNHGGLLVNCSSDWSRYDIRGYAEQVGGLVGFNAQGGMLLWCSAESSTRAVRSLDSRAGGLVGQNHDGTIEQCGTAVENVIAYNYELGGVVGYNYLGGVIRNSYSRSRVVGGDAVAGGVVGYNSGTVTASYASEFVMGSQDTGGGLAGRNFGTVRDSFWDTVTTGHANAVGSGDQAVNCYGLPTSILYQESTYTGDYGVYWDFDKVWWIDEGLDYPRLCGLGDPLSPPQDVFASQGEGGGVTIAWSDVVYEGGCGPFYRVYRAQASGGPMNLVDDWQEQTAFTDWTAFPNEGYDYWVVAAATTYESAAHGLLAARESGLSAPALGWSVLGPPASVMASDDIQCAIIVQWEVVPYGSYYRVYRADSEFGLKDALGDWQGDRLYVDTDIAPEQEYFYWVTAATSSGGDNESDFGGPDVGGAIVGSGCEPCYADFDGDGVVNTADVIAFLAAWVARDSDADWDGNNIFNSHDVTQFLNDWVAGC